MFDLPKKHDLRIGVQAMSTGAEVTDSSELSLEDPDRVASEAGRHRQCRSRSARLERRDRRPPAAERASSGRPGTQRACPGTSPSATTALACFGDHSAATSRSESAVGSQMSLSPRRRTVAPQTGGSSSARRRRTSCAEWFASRLVQNDAGTLPGAAYLRARLRVQPARRRRDRPG